jgi:hypothetical protein
MKNYLKDKIFNSILEILEADMPQLSEATRRKMADNLTNNTYSVYKENSEGIVKQTSEAISDLEKHRGLFKQYIDVVQKNTNLILANFKQNGFVTKKYDENTKKTILKGRTTMVDDMVYFLNELNDLVLLFYKDVYKVEETTKDQQQITLF